MAGRRRHWVAWAGLLGLLGGCAAPVGPEVLSIDRAHYEAAFDAALEAARIHDLAPAHRDRRAGTIETEHHIAPSLLEPWRQDGTRFSERFAQTLACDRRWARFEFTPADAPPAEPTSDTLRGPDVLGLQPTPDQTEATGDLELRVEVYVERLHQPDLRRSTWTRAATTSSETYREGADEPVLPRTFWTPLRRDRRFERLLLARVESMLAEAAAPEAGDGG